MTRLQGFSGTEFAAAMALAEQMATSAGKKLLAAKGSWSSVDSQIGRDIKLRADREAEAIVVEGLRGGSPYPILSEESGAIGALDGAGIYWVVDPLDGTHNYLRGLPLCCVSIALCRGDTPVFGCIYDFNAGELFTGGEDVPLRCNGAPVTSVPAADILATGLPRKGDFSADRLAKFGPHVAKWKQVRLIGSAALSLAWVAAGRFDAYEEAGILWWDVAAGVALVRSAGGQVSVSGDLLGGTLDVRAYR